MLFRSIAKKNNLQVTDVRQLALWPYGDYQLRPQWDVTSSMEKARKLSFDDAVDTRVMFRKQFENYRAQRIIP